MPRPKLVLVAGVPGAGKTTLASRIGELLPAPTLFKDAIKEGISLTEGVQGSYGGPIAERTFAAFYAAIDAMVSQGCTVVAEAAFHRDWFLQEVSRFSEKADLCLVVCDVPRHVAHERHRHRAERGDTRRLAHPDEVILQEMSEETFHWDAYDLGVTGLATLRVDTSSAYRPALAGIIGFIAEPG